MVVNIACAWFQTPVMGVHQSWSKWYMNTDTVFHQGHPFARYIQNRKTVDSTSAFLSFSWLSHGQCCLNVTTGMLPYQSPILHCSLFTKRLGLDVIVLIG